VERKLIESNPQDCYDKVDAEIVVGILKKDLNYHSQPINPVSIINYSTQ